MEKPPSCETCTNERCYHHPQHFRRVGLWSKADHEKVWEFTKEYGALCHPQAREYLMADVLKELQKKVDCTAGESMDEEYYSGCRDARKEAIALIKNGVGGK